MADLQAWPDDADEVVTQAVNDIRDDTPSQVAHRVLTALTEMGYRLVPAESLRVEWGSQWVPPDDEPSNNVEIADDEAEAHRNADALMFHRPVRRLVTLWKPADQPEEADRGQA